MATLSVPSPDRNSIFLEYNAALEFRQEILQTIEREPVTLDFRDVQWIETAELTPLACLINELRQDGHRIEIIPPEDSWVRKWFSKIHFPEGTTKPPRWLSGNQLPLFRIDQEVNPDLDKATDHIRRLLKKQIEGSVNPFMYPVQEIIANVTEHSQSDTAFIMVQNYPNKECIDICITDNGVSIPGNYDSHSIPYESETDAVRMALEEGVSTKGEGRGYGLRTTGSLVCEGLGGDVLLSSSGGMIMKRRSKQRTVEGRMWDGTTFVARLYPPSGDFHLYDYLE